MIPTPALVLFISLLAVAPMWAASPADKPVTSTAAERVKAFRWFETLGFPDLKGRKAVRVATGDSRTVNNGVPRNTYVDGFLIAEKGQTFTVFLDPLDTRTFTKTPPGTPEHERVGYLAIGVAKAASDRLLALREEAGSGVHDRWRGYGRILPERVDLFVLAWACWRNGLDGLAGDLFDHAGAAHGRSPRPKPGELQKTMAADIAHGLMWQGIVDFGYPEVARAQLLERFEYLVRHFPDSAHQKRARATAELLKKMVREDAEHAKRRKGGKRSDDLSKTERIAELVFRLRDQTGHQWSYPGGIDIFSFPGGNQDTPADLLLKVGHDAVPQLIEALGDERFTRAVWCGRSFRFSHEVLTVGECARRILGRIAGRSFEGKAAEVRAWYEELRNKGEKVLLIEATVKGDDKSYDQGLRLLEKYPDTALPALIAGARAASESWTRSQLVYLIGYAPGDGPLPFLVTEATDGPSLPCRLAAARALHRSGRSEGVKAMIADWDGTRRPRKDEKIDRNWDAHGQLRDFLVHAGTVEAVTALGKDLGKRSVDQRLSIVKALADVPLGAGDEKLYDDPARLRAAVERVLVAALDDTEERTGLMGSWGGTSYTDPRICDMAGHVLSRLDREKYPFDLNGTRAQRERGRILLKNGWRRAHGLSVQPLPVPRRVHPIPEARLRPLLDRLLAATDADRPAVQRDVERFGVEALPGVLSRQRAVRGDERAVKLLDGVARRLSVTVTEIEVAEKSLAPDSALAARLAALKGKPLEPQGLIDLVGDLVKEWPNEARTFRCVAERVGDGTGVTLRIDLLDTDRTARRPGWEAIGGLPARGKGPPSSWSCTECVTVGGMNLHHSGGSGETWKGVELLQKLSEACAAAPDRSFDVRVELTPRW